MTGFLTRKNMHHHVRITHVMCEIRPISWPQYFPATQAQDTHKVQKLMLGKSKYEAVASKWIRQNHVIKT